MPNIDPLFKLSQHLLKVRNQSFRRYFIENNHLDERCAILKGQRGVGKTTLIIQYLLDYVQQDRFDKRILYIQADHFALGLSSLYDIAETFSLMGGEYIAFDEIHKYPNWSMELKSIYDTFPDLKIIASGSSALAIHKGSHDLSRRALIYSIPGLSLREYLQFSYGVSLPSVTLDEIINHHQSLSNTITELLANQKLKILPLFIEYLRHGYYPYYFELNNENKFYTTLEQNVHTTLESDIAAIFPSLTSASIYAMRQLLSYTAQHAPFTPNMHNIAKTLSIGDERTLKTYFTHLQSAELISILYKTTDKLAGKYLAKKIFLQNTNLHFALGREMTDQGTLREIFFHMMLSNQHQLTIPSQGDFSVDGQLTFEIGGRKKDFNQIRNIKNSYIAADNMEVGFDNKIPLWLFGFLY